MSEPASISSGIAKRYATAVFEIVRDNNNLAKLEINIADLTAALHDSADLRELINSPVYSREAQEAAIAVLGKKMGMIPSMKNVLGLLAQKRRLFVLPHMLTAMAAMIADHKGEMTADVTSAQAMTPAQTEALAATLSKQFGKTVKIKTSVDETLIGGLVVKLGSKMIDTSIRAKLNSLQNAMKEVG